MISLNARAQDPMFTQTQATGIYLNPANAGHYDGLNANLVGRIQYLGLGASQAYRTSLASLDGYTNQKTRVALGAYFLTDRAGASKMTANTFQAMASHYVDFGGLRRNQNVLRYGLAMGYSQRSVNYDDLVFGDQLNLLGRSATSAENLAGMDFASMGTIATGLKLTIGGNTFLGASYQHYVGSRQNFITNASVADVLFMPRMILEVRHKRKLRPNLARGRARNHGLVSKSIGKFDAAVEPYLIMRYQGKLGQTQFRQLDAGLLFNYQEFRIGAAYRGLDNTSALCFIAGFELKTMPLLLKPKDKTPEDAYMRIFYSYDAGLGALARGFGPTHELSVSYHIKPRKPRRPSEECPNLNTTHAFFKN